MDIFSHLLIDHVFLDHQNNLARDRYAVVEDSQDDRKINSQTWLKKGPGARWTKADTDLFYEVRLFAFFSQFQEDVPLL